MTESLVHQLFPRLARIALTGRRQDVMLFLRRAARQLENEAPGLSSALHEQLRSAPTREDPLREAVADPVPVDADTRLSLLRIEEEPDLDVRPIWAESLRSRLDEFVEERRQEARLARAGLELPKSLLFVGPPGVGKTLAARWVARELGLPLLTLDLAAVMSSFLGKTGNNLRFVLDYAKRGRRVLLLDEFDSIAKRRDDSAEIGELKRLVTVLLQEIDDWPPIGVLIAATNHPNLLDPAVWRRFDQVVEFPMPDHRSAEAAIREHLGQIEDDPAWPTILASALAGTSFSEIRREISRLRRESVTQDVSLQIKLEEFVRQRTGLLSRAERGIVAAALTAVGVSQRRTHELTGVSRDTIRRKQGQSLTRKGGRNGKGYKIPTGQGGGSHRRG